MNTFRDNLATVTQDRDEWREKAEKAEREVNDYKQKLDRLNSILNPLRAVSGDVNVA